MGKYIMVKGSLNFKGTNLPRDLFVTFWHCSSNTVKVSSLWISQFPFMTVGDQSETLGGTPYNLGIGVAASAMLSIAHSSVPLRIRK